MKQILDVCCGSRMFYSDPNNPNVDFCDNRCLETTYPVNRKLIIKPDHILDFRDLPFDDQSYALVIYDPPHLNKVGDNSWLAKKYGRLPKEWKPYLKSGFDECWRVLKVGGTLLFKWNEDQIKKGEVIKLFEIEPLLYDKRGKTFWIVYFKASE